MNRAPLQISPAVVAGRVRVVVDLTGLQSGTWTLRLRRVDGAGREQDTTACAFELR